MIETFKDLVGDDAKTPEDIDKRLQEKLGIGLGAMSEALCVYLKEKAEEVAEDCFSIAPYGDYSKMVEDKVEMAKFLREEAAKPEHWKLDFLEVKKKDDKLIEFVFVNSSVDDGDILKGFVFVGFSGIIRHAFAQVHT
jgi:hypothetical protein